MKPQDDQSEKSTRRQFVKIAAATLVAAPVISSLSSCTQQSAPTTPGGAPTPSPSPQTLTRSDKIRSGNRPPVIIDGGSLHFSSAAKLKKDSKPGPTARPNRHIQEIDPTGKYPTVYGHVLGFRVTNDYGDLLSKPGDEVGAEGKELMVKVWLQTGEIRTDGTIKYDEPYDYRAEPQFVFQDKPESVPGDHTSFVVEYFEEFTAISEEQVKGPQVRAKYGKLDIGHGTKKVFRIRRVQVSVNKSIPDGYDSGDPTPDDLVHDGFRIIILFPQGMAAKPSPSPSPSPTSSTKS
ncbi:MAG: hypothetical protein H7Y30_07265 [Pyrinomonadaceae bacterium]|nr:hypothetical protein [Pyrinomonadaceae bacterium]